MVNDCDIESVRTIVLRLRAQRLGNRAAWAFSRFVRLYLRYSPDQPRDDRGRFAEGDGEATPDVDETGSTTPRINNAVTGDLQIDSITDKLMDKLADVQEQLGEGSGLLYGIAVHSAFAKVVRESGIPGLQVEGSWLQGESLFRYGFAGSIRTDVALRTIDEAHVLAIWDVKTGDASLSRARVDQIRFHAGVGADVPVIELSIRRGIAIKTVHQANPRRVDMPGSDLLILTRRKLTQAEWQGSIDERDHLVRLVLEPAGGDAQTGSVRAALGGRAVTFTFDERPLPAAAAKDGMAFCFAASGYGELADLAAGGIAALAYLAATDGALFQDDGMAHKTDGMAREFDAVLAVVFDKQAEYRARYPDEPFRGDRDGDAGPTTIVAKRSPY